MEFKNKFGLKYCSAPNRYRTIEKEVFNTPEKRTVYPFEKAGEFEQARKGWADKVLELQKREFPDDAEKALGMDINPDNYCDEVLVWRE